MVGSVLDRLTPQRVSSSKRVGIGSVAARFFDSKKQDAMTQITVKLTAQELELLSSLASDQLFRREFIDPRLPGYKSNPAEVSIGKKLVERLRAMTDQAKGKTVPPRNGATASKVSV